MGNTGTIGMAGAVAEGYANLETAVSWQLQSNHYPPVPQEMVGPCIAAIEALAWDDGYILIDLPDGITYRDSESAPAHAIVEQHHLWPFVDMVTSEWEDDDE